MFKRMEILISNVWSPITFSLEPLLLGLMDDPEQSPLSLFLCHVDEGFCRACPRIKWRLGQVKGRDGTPLTLGTYALDTFHVPGVYLLRNP